MCICVAESVMTNTKLYVGEGNWKGQDVHVLAYQNNAESRIRGPNAMVLPFPTTEKMTEENVIDTRKFRGFLQDITDASKILTKSLGARTLGVAAGSAGMAQVFNVGSYTVVLAEHVKQVPEALQRVPESRRPEISYRFLLHYNTKYPNQPVAICCWNGYIEAEPLLWWYVPKDKNTFFIPTMDAHDGNPPDVSAKVKMDHIISVGSNNDNRIGHRYRVRYQDKIPENVISLFPGYVYAKKFGGIHKNGDMFVDTNKLSAGSMIYKDIPVIKKGANINSIDSDYNMDGWSY